MTQNKVKALLRIMDNLNSVVSNIKSELIESLTPNNEDDLIPLLNDPNLSGDDVFAYLKENAYFKNAHIEKGGNVSIPELELDTAAMSMRINLHIDDIVLSAYNSCADYGSEQISICCNKNHSAYDFDVALAEIKRGELATVHNMPADNKNIDLYVFCNPEQEDYTYKTQMEYDAVMSVTERIDSPNE